MTDTNKIKPVAWALIVDEQIRLMHHTLDASLSAQAKWPDAYKDCSHEGLYDEAALESARQEGFDVGYHKGAMAEIAQNKELRAELASAHADIEREVGEWNSEVAAHEVTRLKLAEAEAHLTQVLTTAEKMRCAGGPQEFQHYFDDLKSYLLRKNNSEALTALLAVERERVIEECAVLVAEECSVWTANIVRGMK